MALLHKPFASGCISARAPRPQARCVVVVAKASSSEVSRRELISGVISSTALLVAAPAFAAYGDSANVFGRKTNTSGAIPYAGDGFTLSLPARWNPSREEEFAYTVLRYVDNGAAANNLTVIAEPSSKSKIEDYGSPEDFLSKYGFLFGQQSYSGETQSEGGFAKDRVSAASIIEIRTDTDKKGRSNYYFEVLVRTADGDEGGKHQVIKSVVAEGKLWIIKVQVGDKRWFKGANKDAMLAVNSFTVA